MTRKRRALGSLIEYWIRNVQLKLDDYGCYCSGTGYGIIVDKLDK